MAAAAEAVVAMMKKVVAMAVAAPKVKVDADAVVSQLNQIILRCCFRISYFGTTFLVFMNLFFGQYEQFWTNFPINFVW